MNSCRKGKRGERLWRDELRAMGFGDDTIRGQQHKGGSDSPDVICPQLNKLHCEVKVGYPHMDLGTRALAEACRQAMLESGEKRWYVAWKPDRKPWRLTFMYPGIGIVTACDKGTMMIVLNYMNTEPPQDHRSGQ